MTLVSDAPREEMEGAATAMVMIAPALGALPESPGSVASSQRPHNRSGGRSHEGLHSTDEEAGDGLGQGLVEDTTEGTEVVPVVTSGPPISFGCPPSSGRTKLTGISHPAPLQSRGCARDHHMTLSKSTRGRPRALRGEELYFFCAKYPG